MLLAQPGDDLGPGRGNVPQHLAPDGGLERFDHIGREALGVGGKGPVQDDAADLPVARRGVLPRRSFGEPAVRRPGLRLRGHAVDPREVTQPQLRQVGRVDASLRSCHVPERVRPDVAVGLGVGGPAHAEGVAHHQGDPFDVLPRRHHQAPFGTARARGWAA